MQGGAWEPKLFTYLLYLLLNCLLLLLPSVTPSNIAFDMLSFSCNNVPIPFIHKLALALVFIPFIPNFSAASKMQLIKTSAASSQLRRVSPNFDSALHWSHNVRPTLASAQKQQCHNVISATHSRKHSSLCKSVKIAALPPCLVLAAILPPLCFA